MSSMFKRKFTQTTKTNNLFECCLLVGLNVSDLQPSIEKKYPEHATVPPWVEHLCFPDASKWSSSSNNYQDCQCYSLVITDEKGGRKYGYCRRVVPEKESICLPLTYCIISSYRAPGFYHKVLQELECRHGLPFGLQETFVRQLYNSKFPLPGESVQIPCTLIHEILKFSKKIRRWHSFNNLSASLNSLDLQNQNFRHSMLEFNNNMDDTYQFLHLPKIQLYNDCHLGDVVIKRPSDSRSENTDLTTLFHALNFDTLMQTFGSLLHERKVILVSNYLSKLSSCIEALHSILYPFHWQFPCIQVLSGNMLGILDSPAPLICGVLATHITKGLLIEEGIVVNLDTSTLVCDKRNKNDIIPKRLQKDIKASLQLMSKTETDDRTKNVYVSDAFITMFVKVCGCYKQFIVTDVSGRKIFKRESFIEKTESKSIRLFLEWFSITAMFNHFIQSRLNGEEIESLFEQKCIELNNVRQTDSCTLSKQKCENILK